MEPDPNRDQNQDNSQQDGNNQLNTQGNSYNYSGYQGKYNKGSYQGGKGQGKQYYQDYYQGGNTSGGQYQGGYKKGGGYKGNYGGEYKQQYNNDYNYKKSSGGGYKGNMRINQLTEQETIDPYVAQMLVLRAEMYILGKYPYLIDINTKNEGLSKKLTDKSKFFVIKSFSDEDVHKSIKYNVWSSTKSGNQTLNNCFKTKEGDGEVFLLFSTNGSGRFVGLAKMKSEVDFDKMFIYWTQDGKWGGMMNIEWLFIKDVPFKEFRNIIILMKDGQVKPVSNSRDTQEIPFAEGVKMVEVFETYLNANTILEHFEYYDMRQENYEKSNQSHS